MFFGITVFFVLGIIACIFFKRWRYALLLPGFFCCIGIISRVALGMSGKRYFLWPGFLLLFVAVVGVLEIDRQLKQHNMNRKIRNFILLAFMAFLCILGLARIWRTTRADKEYIPMFSSALVYAARGIPEKEVCLFNFTQDQRIEFFSGMDIVVFYSGDKSEWVYSFFFQQLQKARLEYRKIFILIQAEALKYFQERYLSDSKVNPFKVLAAAQYHREKLLLLEYDFSIPLDPNARQPGALLSQKNPIALTVPAILPCNASQGLSLCVDNLLGSGHSEDYIFDVQGCRAKTSGKWLHVWPSDSASEADTPVTISVLDSHKWLVAQAETRLQSIPDSSFPPAGDILVVGIRDWKPDNLPSPEQLWSDGAGTWSVYKDSRHMTSRGFADLPGVRIFRATPNATDDTVKQLWVFWSPGEAIAYHQPVYWPQMFSWADKYIHTIRNTYPQAKLYLFLPFPLPGSDHFPEVRPPQNSSYWREVQLAQRALVRYLRQKYIGASQITLIPSDLALDAETDYKAPNQTQPLGLSEAGVARLKMLIRNIVR